MQSLDSLPRAESAQRRFAIIKLQKDFDRVRPIVQTMIRESSSLKVGNNKNTPDSGNSRNQKAGKDTERGNEPKLLHAVLGQDVDDLIMEEREQDIMRLNRDVALVNEMFK